MFKFESLTNGEDGISDDNFFQSVFKKRSVEDELRCGSCSSPKSPIEQITSIFQSDTKEEEVVVYELLSKKERAALIKRKLVKNKFQFGKEFKKNERLLNHFGDILSDELSFKSFFFEPKFSKAQKNYVQIGDMLKKKNEHEKFEVSQTDLKKSLFTPNQKVRNFLNIKIVILEKHPKDTEISSFSLFSNFIKRYDYPKKNFRKYSYNILNYFSQFSPILFIFPIEVANIIFEFAHNTTSDIGYFTVGVVVGPFLLRWEESNICVPKRCISYASMLHIDIEQIATLKNVEQALKILSKIIVKWNTVKFYSEQNRRKDKYGNSQNFVKEIIRKLGIQLPRSPLNYLLQRIEERGKEKMKFYMEEKLKLAFNISVNFKVFSSHKELDDFSNKLFEIDPEFSWKFKYEYMYLKMIDRYFWYRYFLNNV